MRSFSTVYILSAFALAAAFSAAIPAMADEAGQQTARSRSIIFVGGRSENVIARLRTADPYDVPANETRVNISDAVSINPQPLPPRYLRHLNRRLDAVSINPQPLPPRY